MTRSIDHTKEIVVTQRSYAGDASLVEAARLEALLDDALRMNGDLKARWRSQSLKSSSLCRCCS
jgi:hypothetical protein